MVVADFPLKWTVAGMDKLIDEGVMLSSQSQRAIPARIARTEKSKTEAECTINWPIMRLQIGKVENNWALMLDTDGFVAEGTGDNIFFVKGWGGFYAKNKKYF